MKLNKHLSMLRHFQTTFKQPVDLHCSDYRENRSDLRNKLFREERGELLDAMADIAYIVLGTAVECKENMSFSKTQYTKIRNLSKSYFGSYRPFDEAFKRVHEANMAKLVDGKPLVNGVTVPMDESKPYGKILKPEGWQKPVFDDLV